jgi:hypothetical protein
MNSTGNAEEFFVAPGINLVLADHAALLLRSHTHSDYRRNKVELLLSPFVRSLGINASLWRANCRIAVFVTASTFIAGRLF